MTGTHERPIGVSRFQVIITLITIVATAIVYPRLPERIPLHWNIQGDIDRWGASSFGNVFLTPLILLGIVVLFWLLPRIDPFRRSYGRFAGSYTLIIDMIAAFLVLLHALTLYAAFNTDLPVGIVAPGAIGLLFAVIGNQLAKLKRNFFIGFRTPWTLASDKVWMRTHRIGARLFVAAGLAAALSAFLPPPLNFIVFLVLIVGTVAAVFLYSYLYYRQLERRGELEAAVEAARQ